MRHKIIAVMEKNNGEEMSNTELRETQRLLQQHGWDNIEFKRVRTNSSIGRELLTKIWDFVVE
jgi:hypothetical protein